MTAIGPSDGFQGISDVAMAEDGSASTGAVSEQAASAPPDALHEAAGALASSRFSAGLLERLVQSAPSLGDVGQLAPMGPLGPLGQLGQLGPPSSVQALVEGALATTPAGLLPMVAEQMGLGMGAGGAPPSGLADLASRLAGGGVVFAQPARFGQIELPPDLKAADDALRGLTRALEDIAARAERDGDPTSAAILRQAAVNVEQARVDHLYPGEIDWQSQKVPAGYHRGPPSQAAADEAKRLRELEEPPGSGTPKYPRGSKIAWRDPNDGKRYLIVIERHANIGPNARGATALSQD